MLGGLLNRDAKLQLSWQLRAKENLQKLQKSLNEIYDTLSEKSADIHGGEVGVDAACLFCVLRACFPAVSQTSGLVKVFIGMLQLAQRDFVKISCPFEVDEDNG